MRHKKKAPTPPTFDAETESAYRAWMNSIGHTREAGFAVQPDYSGENYDYRGYFQKYGPVQIGEGEHLYDEFKLPSHPTFSRESVYAVGENKKLAGRWKGETFIPPRALRPKPLFERLIERRQGKK